MKYSQACLYQIGMFFYRTSLEHDNDSKSTFYKNIINILSIKLYFFFFFLSFFFELDGYQPA